jgi:hypothetical protein
VSERGRQQHLGKESRDENGNITGLGDGRMFMNQGIWVLQKLERQ